ncbi:MAG: hypothetical protein J5928_06310 [Firmicutes bacterium]|nr:hypothetical protein [Bacillota bacterium]
MKRKAVIMTLAATILATVFLTGCYNPFMNMKYKNATLEEISWGYGGGMLGGHSGIRLKDNGDGTATLITENRPTHMDRMVTVTYTVPSDTLTEVQKIMMEHRLPSASTRGMSKWQVLDGDTGSMSFYFAEKEGFYVHTEQALRRSESEGIFLIRDYLASLTEGLEGKTELEPHEMYLLIDGYNINFIMNDCKAVDELVEMEEEHEIISFADNAKIIRLDRVLDVADALPATGGEAGTMAYHRPSDDKEEAYIIVFYAPFEPYDGLFELGKIEYYSENAMDLIKNLEDGKTGLWVRK